MLSSCGVISRIKSTIQSPTPIPPYLHYTPSKEFNVHLEFDYPSSWLFSEDKIQDTDILIVGLGDPRLLMVPTRAPNESHGTPSDYGRISILIQPAKPDLTLDTGAEMFIKANSESNWLKFLNDYKVKIDGYDTRVIEYQINDPESYSSIMFERRLFFIIKDQVYEIYFTIAEKDRGGEFEQGYEYFSKSIKIIP